MTALTERELERVVAIGIVVPPSNLWADYDWPEWVPASERALIEKFYSWHDGVRGWARSATCLYNGSPWPPHALGERLKVWAGYRRPRAVVGRHLHRWNNITVVITDDGVVEPYMSVVDAESIERARLAMAVRRANIEREFAALVGDEAALEAAVRP